MSVIPPLHRVPPIVVMGVAGAGKTDIGTMLATRLDVDFMDGDDLHPQANIDKMASGHPLNDDDRRPWLANIAAWLSEHTGEGAVVACSALKRMYRDQLRQACPDVVFIHLAGDREVVTERVTARAGHFMPASLVDSQYATLEPLTPDEVGITLNFDASRDELTDEAATWVASLE
ncbi:gluconokinase [Cutibacterium equinum]|uniref:Gluconokinase n=1 Tax=Cutibacterium equinum TaxID=3016342 RepID=A0ABY7QZT6_9ACTN|nr:gluconokinase [Cutibacterium equinum]WCC80563.1 gluconokinase [Cutibacterium equinum]